MRLDPQDGEAQALPVHALDGRWALQFDTKKKYVKGTALSRFLWDRLTLTIG